MTPTQILAWYKDPSARRVILIEANVKSGGSEITRYFSMGGYNSFPTDSTPNIHYLNIAKQGETYTEEIPMTSKSNLSFGDIELDNPNGVHDAWLRDIWMNRSVTMWLGDASWSRDDFIKIFDGVSSGLAPKDRDVLALKLRDKSQRLNTPITEQLLGGTTTNKGALIPLCFGECFNITPLLIDPVLLKYQVHNGSVQSIFEVRDNGIPVTFTADNSTGTFTLAAQPKGVVTCSVYGDNYGGTYRTTLSAIVQRIVTGFGKASDRFTSSDLDATQLAAFDSAHTQTMGIYITSRTNVLNVVESLCVSLDAHVVMSRLGLMRILRIDMPGTGTSIDVLPKHMVVDDIKATAYVDPVAAIKLGFDRNYTVQEALDNGLSARDRDFFAQEWLTSTQTNTTTQSDYKLNTEPVQVDTCLKSRTETDAEANRQLALWSVPRYTYEVNCLADMLSLELGQAITVYNRRHEMSTGKPATVTSLAVTLPDLNVKVGFIL